MTIYGDRFWKKNWDDGLEDLDPSAWNTSFPAAIQDSFDSFPDKAALAFQGKEVTFGELDKYANQFANMLIDNGFGKGPFGGYGKDCRCETAACGTSRT